MRVSLNPIQFLSFEDRRLEHGYVQREDCVKTQGRDGPLKAKDKAPSKTNPGKYQCFDFLILTSRIVRKYLSVFKTSTSKNWVICVEVL